jgi:hypothetical protein
MALKPEYKHLYNQGDDSLTVGVTRIQEKKVDEIFERLKNRCAIPEEMESPIKYFLGDAWKEGFIARYTIENKTT